MAKQKKILDIHDGTTHLICIQHMDRSDYNPFRVYAVISAPGSPLRKRQLVKYGDFMSVLYFIQQFFRDGLDTMPLCDVLEWIKARSI